MTSQPTIKAIRALQQHWNRKKLAANAWLSFAISIPAAALLFFFTHSLLLSFLFFFGFSALLILYFSRQYITENEITDYLNRNYPALQESAHLLTKRNDELTLLENLQLKKITPQVEEARLVPKAIRRKAKRNVSLFFFSFLCVLAGGFASPFLREKQALPNSSFSSSEKIPKEKIPAGIQISTITVSPPAYTHRSFRNQSSFNIKAEEGAMITWDIIMYKDEKDVQLKLNNQTVLRFKKDELNIMRWTARLRVDHSAFYQLISDGKKSDMYAIEMIPDAPPQIVVRAPKQSATIPAGQSKTIDILASATDDYGIDSILIHATTASGGGEAVTFKQLTFSFPHFHYGTRNTSLEKKIDLSALGLTPGDELYFYISVTDNHHAEKRSDVYAVRLEDTAQLMSLSGLATGLDIRPELFRSQRQIIIQTEGLLKDKDTISVSQFNNRSDEIGTDQQLLRLRYGKYLGEETESETDPTVGGAQTNDAADFGNQNKVIDRYSDKHDNAEDAGFFDAATKKQLQNMLSEMWKASLQLKIHQPKAALPFEYNALRLLKQLQQKERAYVAKTGVQTTPLDFGKRLNGELDKVIEPTAKEIVHQPDSSLTHLRKAMAVLEKMRGGEAIQKEDQHELQNALQIVSVKAASQPELYLASYQSLQKLNEGVRTAKEIAVAGRGLQRLIQSLRLSMQSESALPDMGLSRYYYHHIKQ